MHIKGGCDSHILSLSWWFINCRNISYFFFFIPWWYGSFYYLQNVWSSLSWSYMLTSSFLGVWGVCGGEKLPCTLTYTYIKYMLTLMRFSFRLTFFQYLVFLLWYFNYSPAEIVFTFFAPRFYLEKTSNLNLLSSQVISKPKFYKSSSIRTFCWNGQSLFVSRHSQTKPILIYEKKFF